MHGYVCASVHVDAQAHMFESCFQGALGLEVLQEPFCWVCFGLRKSCKMASAKCEKLKVVTAHPRPPVSKNQGPLFGSPYKQGQNMLGSIWRPPALVYALQSPPLNSSTLSSTRHDNMGRRGVSVRLHDSELRLPLKSGDNLSMLQAGHVGICQN